MEYNFELAKKIAKVPAGTKGITLRSIKGDCENAVLVIMSTEGYSLIRELINTQKAHYGDLINGRARGRSYEISASSSAGNALKILMEIASYINFCSEDVMELTEFVNMTINEDSGLKIVSADGGIESVILEISTDIENDEEKNKIFSSIENNCEKYGVGIIKERPEPLM